MKGIILIVILNLLLIANSNFKSINLKVTKTKDNKQIDITQKVKWLISPKGAVIIDKNILIAKKDINTTIQAKYKNLSSNRVLLNIYWEVNGHILPPEPDPKVNNATLLGVDVNKNGVRDDVERKIYEKYKVKLQRVLLIDEAKVFQKILISPLSQAQKLAKEDTKKIDCQLFIMDIDKNINSISLFENNEKLKNIIFNTKNRAKKYLDYNIALSGGVYGSSPKDWNRKACSKEVLKVLEEMGK